jgi:hypothetical protein
MNWMNILKRKVDTYEEYKKERERLLQEQKREQQKILDSLFDENGKRKRFLNNEEMKEMGKINEPLNNFDDINEEYYDRMISDEKFAEENEKRIKRERERKAQMQERGLKGRRHGGRKKNKKRKGQFQVQRGSGQSKSQRRSGGRDDSRRFRKL